jgi:hypothetical protein
VEDQPNFETLKARIFEYLTERKAALNLQLSVERSFERCYAQMLGTWTAAFGGTAEVVLTGPDMKRTSAALLQASDGSGRAEKMSGSDQGLKRLDGQGQSMTFMGVPITVRWLPEGGAFPAIQGIRQPEGSVEITGETALVTDEMRQQFTTAVANDVTIFQGSTQGSTP